MSMSKRDEDRRWGEKKRQIEREKESVCLYLCMYMLSGECRVSCRVVVSANQAECVMNVLLRKRLALTWI